MYRITRFTAVVVLSTVYAVAAGYSRVAGWLRRKPKQATGRVMLIGTFHNPNWFHAHVPPVVEANGGNVILVCDEPVDDIDGLEVIYPPRLANRLLSRAGAKLFWALAAAIRLRPDIVMGYHIFPSAIIGLIVGRSTNARVGYQMTGGQLETEGGGWHAENVVMRSLGEPSAIAEKRVLSVVRQFDEVIVRGSRAENHLREHGFAGPIRTITGSVMVPDQVSDFDSRPYDLIFVGRLTEYKRPDRLLKVIAGLVEAGLGDLKVLIIGDGPDREELQATAKATGIDGNIEWAGQRSDVLEQLQRARMFILTSRWEGVSIALLEAMVGGLVPVVSNVGDMADVVHDGDNGFIPHEENTDAYIAAITAVARNRDTWGRMSAAARTSGIAKASREAVAARWRQMFKESRPEAQRAG
jgi:glycosyltransferase involved in cell wall biosynthesis